MPVDMPLMWTAWTACGCPPRPQSLGQPYGVAHMPTGSTMNFSIGFYSNGEDEVD